MRTTTDLHTGRPFRWNEVVAVQLADGTFVNVPGRFTKTTATHLHPARVPARLLAELNKEEAPTTP